MFLSFQYLGCDPRAKENSYLYKIIDSEFEEVVAAPPPIATSEIVVEPVASVEKVYRQRGFSHPQIAKQIFLCMRYASQKYDYSMNDSVSDQKKYIPELWAEYGQEINKFLLFS